MSDVRLRLIKSIAAAKADENDIVLVLDSSGSIGNSDWQKMLQACETLLTTMSSKPIRVAVVVFACTASIICQWTADYVSVMATLYAHKRSTGGTNTPDGLQKARELFITGSAAKRGRLVFLFTDGYTNNHPAPAAMALRQCQLVGHAIVRTPPPEDTVPEFNIILFGLAGCGKSSFLCSALSALCSSLQMNVTTIGGQSDHVTDRYLRYRLSTYCPGARVNLWDVWGLDVDNFNNDSFKRFLTGNVPDNYNMVEALNTNILDMPDIRASTPAEREIHAVLMFMPLGYLELPEELQAQFRRNVEIAMRQGRNAILVVTRIDTLGTTAEREAYRSRLAEHFKIPSSRIHMIKNYTTEERKTFAIDKPILQLLESAIDFAGQFLAQRRRRIGHAIPAVPMGAAVAVTGVQTPPNQLPKTQPAVAQPTTINQAYQQPVGQVSAVPVAAGAPAGDAAMAPAKPAGPPVAICVWNGNAYFKCRLTAKSTFGAVRTQAVRFLKLPGHADDWFLQDEEQQILMDNELVQETFAGAGAGSIDVEICSNA